MPPSMIRRAYRRITRGVGALVRERRPPQYEQGYEEGGMPPPPPYSVIDEERWAEVLEAEAGAIAPPEREMEPEPEQEGEEAPQWPQQRQQEEALPRAPGAEPTVPALRGELEELLLEIQERRQNLHRVQFELLDEQYRLQRLQVEREFLSDRIHEQTLQLDLVNSELNRRRRLLGPGPLPITPGAGREVVARQSTQAVSTFVSIDYHAA